MLLSLNSRPAWIFDGLLKSPSFFLFLRLSLIALIAAAPPSATPVATFFPPFNPPYLVTNKGNIPLDMRWFNAL